MRRQISFPIHPKQHHKTTPRTCNDANARIRQKALVLVLVLVSFQLTKTSNHPTTNSLPSKTHRSQTHKTHNSLLSPPLPPFHLNFPNKIKHPYHNATRYLMHRVGLEQSDLSKFKPQKPTPSTHSKIKSSHLPIFSLRVKVFNLYTLKY